MIYKLRKIFGHWNFNTLFPKHIKRFIKRGFGPIIIQRTACFVVNPLTVCNHAYLSGLCDDRTDLVLHGDVGLNPVTEGRRRITILSLFGRAFYGFFLAVGLPSDRSSSTSVIG